MVAQLHVIVRRRRRGAGEPEPVIGKRRNQRPRGGARETLEDRTFIQRHGAELHGIERGEAIIVADVDAVPRLVLTADDAHRIAQRQALALNLTCDGERRE